MQVSNLIKNQRAIAKRTSQIMKWTDLKYPNGKWYYGAFQTFRQSTYS